MIAIKTLAFFLCIGVACATPVEAGALSWLAKLSKTGKAAKHIDGFDLPNLESAAKAVRNLRGDAGKGAIAGAISTDGHWRFVNGAGETFTAISREEISNGLRWLAPEIADLPGQRFKLYLTQESALQPPARFKDLPAQVDLYVTTKHGEYRLARTLDDSAMILELRPRVFFKLDDRWAMNEILWQMRRPVNRQNVRVMSLQPGADKSLPRLSPSIGKAGVTPETIDPYALASSLKSMRGQTIIISGRIEGDLLRFKPQRGGEQTLIVDDLRAAAREADVNLIMLNSKTARQPGTRDLLWRMSKVAGLDSALGETSMGKFIDALGRESRPLMVSVEPTGRLHVTIKATVGDGNRRSRPNPTSDGLDLVGSIFTEFMSSVSANVAIRSVQISALSSQETKERMQRILPGIPSAYQYVYILLMVVGLVGLRVALGWWQKIWPLPDVAIHHWAVTRVIGRTVRMALFTFLFLPVIALIAAPYQIIKLLFDFVLAPFRWWRGRTA